jgi:hypothetical protein
LYINAAAYRGDVVEISGRVDGSRGLHSIREDTVDAGVIVDE